MIYTPEETAKREAERERRAWLRSFYRRFAIFPEKCSCCGREYQWQWGWKHQTGGMYISIEYAICKECGPTREAAYEAYMKIKAHEKQELLKEKVVARIEVETRVQTSIKREQTRILFALSFYIKSRLDIYIKTCYNNCMDDIF